MIINAIVNDDSSQVYRELEIYQYMDIFLYVTITVKLNICE